MARHLLVTNDYPPKIGGIQVYLHELWRRLESGRAVVLTASSHEDAVAFDATSDLVVERIAARRSSCRPGARTELSKTPSSDTNLISCSSIRRGRWTSRSAPFAALRGGAARRRGDDTRSHPARRLVASLRADSRTGSDLRGFLSRRGGSTLCGRRPLPIVEVPPGVDTDRFVPVDSDGRHAVRNSDGILR